MSNIIMLSESNNDNGELVYVDNNLLTKFIEDFENKSIDENNYPKYYEALMNTVYEKPSLDHFGNIDNDFNAISILTSDAFYRVDMNAFKTGETDEYGDHIYSYDFSLQKNSIFNKDYLFDDEKVIQDFILENLEEKNNDELRDFLENNPEALHYTQSSKIADFLLDSGVNPEVNNYRMCNALEERLFNCNNQPKNNFMGEDILIMKKLIDHGVDYQRVLSVLPDNVKSYAIQNEQENILSKIEYENNEPKRKPRI
ncbi:hypothetical protein K8Q95_27355 [Escherichia coli]|uniref:hypothetical protein n=1 Tax=Escherichia coli TaxID=562 RepID=UPI00319D6224